MPGIGFAEWGPGDMAFSLGVRSSGSGSLPPALQAARAKVLTATKANKIFFLNTMNADNVIDIDQPRTAGRAEDLLEQRFSIDQGAGLCHINEFYLLLLFAEREPGYAISKTYAGAAATKNSLYLLDVTMPAHAFNKELHQPKCQWKNR